MDLHLHLHGERALVTGASRGIGLATVRALLGEGMQVVAVARTTSDDQTTDEDWHALLELNLMAAVRTIRAALPSLRRTRGVRSPLRSPSACHRSRPAPSGRTSSSTAAPSEPSEGGLPAPRPASELLQVATTAG